MLYQSKLPLLSELRALVDSMEGGSDGASEADVAQDEWRRAADKLDSAASQMDEMSQLWHVRTRGVLSARRADHWRPSGLVGIRLH